MTKVAARPSAEVIQALRELHERRLTADEFEVAAAIPLGEQEIEDTLELVDWFMRRYPTPLQRLRYVRRKTAEWAANRGAELL